jgi:4-hydroxy-3-methylbut-2-en-1-yl diphosphate reductase
VIVVTACFRSETKAIRPRDGVRIVRTGMGDRAADDLARAVADRPGLLLSTGFCGGLAPDLRRGDLVIADEIRSGSEIVRVDCGLVDRARAALVSHGLSLRVGPVVCAKAVADPEEKRGLASQGAVSVDLESASLARWATANAIPFLSCRVVLDSADERMPFSGRWPVWMSVVRHPVRAVRVGRAAAAAAGRLGAGIECLLDAWEGTP